MKLFGHCAAAHHLTAFQHHWLESALRQIKRGDQPIVAAANDQHFLSERHFQLPARAACGALTLPREEFLPPESLDPPFHSFKITWLAIRPGAAIIPPPGCVAEPHI